MYRKLTNRNILLLGIILIVSNLVIASVSIVVIYKKSITSLGINLLDIVERQKSLVSILHQQGKNELDIIQLVKTMREKHYGIGKTGEFAIAQQIGDSIYYMLSNRNKTYTIKYNSNGLAIPMQMALKGKSGSIIAKDYNGEEVLAGYSNLPSLRWGIVAKTPMAEVNQPYREAIVIAVLVSISLLLLCVLLFRKLTNPILKAVIDSEEEYAKLFNNMLNGFAYCKILATPDQLVDFIYLNVNPAFESLTGFKNVIGKKASLVIQDIQVTDYDLLKVYERVALTGKPEALEVYVKAMNEWLFISVYSPQKGYFVAVFDVITDRKNAEIQLKESSEEIKAQNEEYVQINDELYKAKEHAEESDRLKTSFLHNMSHEIRTPMNAIMGFADLLSDQYNNKPKLDQYARIICQRSNDLLDLINELLDTAKIESGQVPLHFEATDLNLLFTDLSVFFEENQKCSGKQHIELNVHPYTLPGAVIITDGAKLKQILINLISNAFKFTEKGTIEVGCELNYNNDLVFFVSDTGAGIPLDKHNLIFERFFQLNQSTNLSTKGTGLGLSIVKGLVNLLGGEIWLESEPQKGTTFYFTIAYKIADTIILAPVKFESDTHFSFSGKTILIVEDDSYNAKFIKETLCETGFKIIHTHYGLDAIDIAITNTIDIILMDIRLPDINGYEATQLIKMKKPDVKIIAQTAYASHEDRLHAINAGCDDYISKPLNKRLLLNMIRKHLTSAEIIEM